MRQIVSSKAADTVSTEQAAVLTKQLRVRGYSSMKEFAAKTGLVHSDGKPRKMAMWTVNRAFKAGAEQVSFVALAQIMMALEFERSYIRDYLEMMGDDFVPAVMGNEDPELSLAETAMVAAIRKLAEKNAGVMQLLAGQMELVAQAAGVDIRDELQRMGRRDVVPRRTIPPTSSE